MRKGGASFPITPLVVIQNREEKIELGGESAVVSISGQAHDLARVEFGETEIDGHAFPEHSDRVRIRDLFEQLKSLARATAEPRRRLFTDAVDHQNGGRRKRRRVECARGVRAMMGHEMKSFGDRRIIRLAGEQPRNSQHSAS